MKALAVGVAALAALVLGAGGAGATNECHGFQTCISVPGPWVVVPAREEGRPAPTVQFELVCPRKGYLVGGLDAQLSDRAIDLTFVGALGTPVAPGTTTGAAVVFVGTYAGSARAPTSFRPSIGCIPTSGRGGRETTAYRATPVFAPGKPTLRRLRTVRLRPRLDGVVSHGCTARERLVGSAAALAFALDAPPPAALLAAVDLAFVQRDERVFVAIRTSAALPRAARGLVQIQAVCGTAR